MSRTLLLADDSVTIQRVIALTFADRDVSVIAVSDGEAALRALAASPPDIVLADIDMPGPSGYEIARHISDTPALRHVPVLLLTGAFEPIDEEKVKASGSDGVLTKPFEPEEVIRKVTELLDDAASVMASVAGPGASSPHQRPQPNPPAAESLAASRVPKEAPVAAASVASSLSSSPAVDDYFEQLDRAFAERLANAQRPEPPPVAPPAEEPAGEARPLLASAFSALLDAEQSDGEAAQIPDWMLDTPSATSSDDALVEAITRRVLERLTDRIVRETVSERVTAIAERLIRDEIERIKSNIT